MEGDGFVAAQDPPPGTPVEEGSVCHLTLARVVARQREIQANVLLEQSPTNGHRDLHRDAHHVDDEAGDGVLGHE